MESDGELSQARGPGLDSTDWSLSYASLTYPTKVAYAYLKTPIEAWPFRKKCSNGWVACLLDYVKDPKDRDGNPTRSNSTLTRA